MYKRMMIRSLWMVVAVAISVNTALAAKKAPPPVELSEAGQKLEAKYAGELSKLTDEIKKALPAVDEKKKTAYQEACQAEKAAETARNNAQKAFGAINSGRGLVAHAKGKWIGGAERGIAETREKIKNAKTDEERKAAQDQLVKWEKNKQDGLDALKERQAKLDAALKEEPRLTKELAAAKEALSDAQAATLQALKDLGIDEILKSDKLDARFAKFAVMSHATPRGLAAYAEKGRSEEKLIKQMFSDDDLLVQIAVAEGAKSGKYGQAMEIYTAIQKASKKANEGVLQRLALGIALEHAVPIGQRNPKANTNAPAHIDPVKRYEQYEKAYLAEELDPGFKGLDVWDYRMVVNGNEPDETLVWGREMLRNYRPDHISNPDYRWRYVGAVRTDIRYGSQYNKFDKSELQFFQNVLMNGGVCGRRAFFGRFMLRSFGIPTTARPQRGHAALVHWTPDGWVVCLGGGWGIGWVGASRGDGGRKPDRDFLAVTQAREDREGYLEVKRAQWVGDVMGEPKSWGLLSGASGFWNTVALYHQRAVIEEAKAVELAAVGTELGEANESKVKYTTDTSEVTDDDRKIVVAKSGVITIPAVACSLPTNSTGKIKFMPSNLGGKQLHYGRTGGAENWEYTFDAPKAGKYMLTARIVTPSENQHLLIAANGAKTPVDIELPLTVGMWDTIDPVEIELGKGKNVLTCSRSGDNIRGLTIRDFTLTPK